MTTNIQNVGAIFCIAMNSVIQVYSGQFESTMCLEQSLEIHGKMKNKLCPDSLLSSEQGVENCLFYCKGTYNTLEISTEDLYCVDFVISFNNNGTQSSKLKDRLCEISNCLSKKPVIVISTTLSCFIVGSIVGIGILYVIYRFRNLKNRFDTQMQSSVFYQSRHSEEHGLSEGRIIINPLEETQYADIEDQFRMVAKAIQVPSYKEDSSSSSRSRENIYHHLSGLEDRAKSVLFSSDSLSEDYINGSKIIEVQNGSPSLKSFIIHAGSPSSKSNGESKVSPTGSGGSDKYYALEKEYMIFKSDNGFA
ncbi:uncharacterized protein LOC133203517 [Saccostrea echinata]|uniref:uncharacterized protein LOC133203517 n=1 Tax=Saccostrea echinata TaxID=191078 RepID=UPI002A823780|nr:uncharacterized protein LOC133203517 [Saccostrea echinata]